MCRAGSSWSQGRVWPADGLWDGGFLESSACPLVGEAGPEARAGSVEGRARPQGILGLVPAHWWVELGPGPSGGQGHILRWLWAQGGLRAAYLLMSGAVSLPS